MTSYRLAIDEITDFEAITIYTRWVDAVQLKRGENEEVYLTFSPSLEHIWMESKKHLLGLGVQKPAAIRLRSKYAIRLYSLAKQYAPAGSKGISLEEVRKILGLESIKDDDGNVIREAPLASWANFRERALNTAIREINAKTDLHIQLKSLERLRHGRVAALTFAIRAQAVPNGHSFRRKIVNSRRGKGRVE
jgi:plasmid replication initiation protein